MRLEIAARPAVVAGDDVALHPGGLELVGLGDFRQDAAHYPLTPDAYLEHLHRVTSAVHIPVFASLNGTTPGTWLEYASLLEEAGAHAIELNVYLVATDPRESSGGSRCRWAGTRSGAGWTGSTATQRLPSSRLKKHDSRPV